MDLTDNEIQRFEYIKKSLDVFDFGSLQESVNVIRMMSASRIAVEELFGYVDLNKNLLSNHAANDNMEKIARAKYAFCPMCHNGIEILTIGHSNCSMVYDENGKLYRTVAWCKNDDQCDWEEFSTLEILSFIRTFYPKDLIIKMSTVKPHETPLDVSVSGLSNAKTKICGK